MAMSSKGSSSSGSPGMEDALPLLECSICMDLCTIPVHQCKNGHNICATHTTQEGLHFCPLCRVPFWGGSVRNILAEKLIEAEIRRREEEVLNMKNTKNAENVKEPNSTPIDTQGNSESTPISQRKRKEGLSSSFPNPNIDHVDVPGGSQGSRGGGAGSFVRSSIPLSIFRNTVLSPPLRSDNRGSRDRDQMFQAALTLAKLEILEAAVEPRRATSTGFRIIGNDQGTSDTSTDTNWQKGWGFGYGPARFGGVGDAQNPQTVVLNSNQDFYCPYKGQGCKFSVNASRKRLMILEHQEKCHYRYISFIKNS